MSTDEKQLKYPLDPDFEAIRAFLDGDRKAFDKLVLNYKDRIFNMCFRMIGDSQDASDTAQDIFFKVYKSLKRFRFKSKFSTWLYRIAVNTCKNKLSSRTFRNRKKTETINGRAANNPHGRLLQVINGSNLPSALLEKKERMTIIQIAIDTLPAPQKTVVVLRDIEGFSYEEIAATTGFNLGTVKSKLARARRALRKKLRGVTGNEM